MSQLLRDQIELLIKLTDEEFEQVLSYFTGRNFRKHQYILQEGHFATQEFFILSGLAKSFYIDNDGKEHIVQFAMDQCWVTDNEAFHHEKPARLNVICLEPCQTLSLSQQQLEKLCAASSKMQYYFRKKAFDEIALLQRRVLCLIKGTASDRYHDLITHFPQLIQRVPKTMIASYLGVSRETLSRMM